MQTWPCRKCSAPLRPMVTHAHDFAWCCPRCGARYATKGGARVAAELPEATVVPLRAGPPPFAFEVVFDAADRIRLLCDLGERSIRPEEARRLARALLSMAHLAEKVGARAAGHDRWRFSGDAAARRASFGNPQNGLNGSIDHSFIEVTLRPMRVRRSRCDACRAVLPAGPAYGAAERVRGSDNPWSDTSVRSLRFCRACVEAPAPTLRAVPSPA